MWPWVGCQKEDGLQTQCVELFGRKPRYKPSHLAMIVRCISFVPE
jgi:hypothetical protein